MHNEFILTGVDGARARFRDQMNAAAALDAIEPVPSNYDFIAHDQKEHSSLLIGHNGQVSASNPSSRTVLSLLEIMPSLTVSDSMLSLSLIEKTVTGFRGISHSGKATYWDRVVTLDGQVCCKSRADGADWPFDTF